MMAKRFHEPIPHEAELLRRLFDLARTVFYDIKTVWMQMQAGNLTLSSRQMLRLFGVYAIHMTLMVIWSILFIAAQSGWLANLTLEGNYLGKCMRDGNAYTGIMMGLVIGNGGFFVYANPRSKVIIISIICS